jgi:hypothetical protein
MTNPSDFFQPLFVDLYKEEFVVLREKEKAEQLRQEALRIQKRADAINTRVRAQKALDQSKYELETAGMNWWERFTYNFKKGWEEGHRPAQSRRIHKKIAQLRDRRERMIRI